MISDADALGVELSQAILTAIVTGEASDTSTKVPQPSAAEQIQYIMKNTSSLNITDRRSLGGILIMNNRKHSLLPSGDGMIINLDQLPANIISQMYEFVSYKINTCS